MFSSTQQFQRHHWYFLSIEFPRGNGVCLFKTFPVIFQVSGLHFVRPSSHLHGPTSPDSLAQDPLFLCQLDNISQCGFSEGCLLNQVGSLPFGDLICWLCFMKWLQGTCVRARSDLQSAESLSYLVPYGTQALFCSQWILGWRRVWGSRETNFLSSI